MSTREGRPPAEGTLSEDGPLRAQRVRILDALTAFGALKREQADGELERILREGQRLQAMQRYRELMGGGLQEAKEAADAMGARISVAPWRPDGQEDESLRAQRARLLGVLVNLGALKQEEARDEAERLVLEGQSRQALKRYRELTGSGLQQARDAVDEIVALSHDPSLPNEYENESQPTRRPWAWLLAAAVACVCIAWLLWRT